MAREDVKVVRRAYAAFGRRDLAAVLDTLHADVVWRVAESTPGIGGIHRGHDAVMDVLCAAPPDPSAFRSEPDDLLANGDRVIVLGHHRARSPRDGGEMTIPFVHVWTMRDGVAVGFDGYSDSPRLGEALEGAQPSEKSGVVR